MTLNMYIYIAKWLLYIITLINIFIVSQLLFLSFFGENT